MEPPSSATPPGDDPAERPGPLAGVRVLDLTTFLSGPFATQLLSDLGAEVIKVEPPDGDSSRHIPPHFIDGDSAYYLANNRGKRSVCVDLKQPGGVDLVRRMVRQADVVVENYRPGVAVKLGLNPAEATHNNPQLIWASISGFGQSGQWRDRPAYDMIVQALSGAMSLTGEPGRPAVRLGIPAGDIVAGMYAVIGLLAALAEVRAGGRGRIVDVSMLDSMLTMLSYQAAYTMYSGQTPEPQGAKHDSIPTYRSFTGADGRELVVTANTERMWRGLCAALDLDGLVADERFDNARSRLTNKHELWALLEKRFASAPADVWVERLVEHQVPGALIKTVPEALLDARSSGREMVLMMEDPERGKFDSIASPIKFVGAPSVKTRFPPRIGADTDRVLRELGVSELELIALREDGTIR